MRTLLLIFALACTAFGQITKCPGPYQAVGTGCYTFVETEVSSWIRASSFCQISGGYLAQIDSELKQMALQAYHDANFNGTHFRWIGATDMLNDDTWRWIPSGSNVIYNNWASGEPVSSYTADCAYWSPLYNYWIAIDCCNDFTTIKPLCEADPL